MVTAAIDPPRARQLIAEAREDDAAMTPCRPRRWIGGSDAVYIDNPAGRGDVVVMEAEGPNRENDCRGIARTRNNLAALADQLEAALAEIERLRTPIGSTGLLERANKMRDRLRELGVDVDGPGYSLDPPFGRLPERVTVDTFKPRNRQR